MPDQPKHAASPAYATGQLARAMARAAEGDERALEKVRRWEDVLTGIFSGQITVGSRVPVVDTPAWVTLEVVHGGFATGNYLAEQEPAPEELAALPDGVPGRTDRERLNLWYLGDAGQAELLQALRSGRYRVEVPEEAAIAVAVLLLDKGFTERALDLIAELRPFMHRLRFTPRFEPVARPSGTSVRVTPVGEVAASLRAVQTPQQITAMRETLRVWNPLYDRLVALWCQTVDGELPYLDSAGAVRGGWPCQRWPVDWTQARADWLADCAQHEPTGRHAHPKSNFARLRGALEKSDALSARDVGWIRRAIANTVTSHGAPGSPSREALRATQVAIATAPTKAGLAQVLAHRLDSYPADGGLPSLGPIVADVSEKDISSDEAPYGASIPEHFQHKAARALEAPIDELVRRGVITSGETLAIVLPQLTSRLLAAGIKDPAPAGLYEQTYTAFRRRRSLLLLNLEHQVQFSELPWVGALAPFRSPQADNAVAAYQSLQQITLLALTSFPHALLPNTLVSELGTLSSQAGLHLPLVEEVAADIFMGTFTTKWRDAAIVASRTMAGTLYAAYYDLPPESHWTPRSITLWGKKTSADFASLCAARGLTGDSGGYVARNGVVLEQSQILTTHNLAVLVSGLGLTEHVYSQAAQLAAEAFGWLVRRLAQSPDSRHAALIQVKNAAYAWRQAIYFLSFCSPSVQSATVRQLDSDVRAAGINQWFGPAVLGLARVIAGERFSPAGTVGEGKRFLGWALGSHWCLESRAGRQGPRSG